VSAVGGLRPAIRFYLKSAAYNLKSFSRVQSHKLLFNPCRVLRTVAAGDSSSPFLWFQLEKKIEYFPAFFYI
jgi:hypothetical protein